MTDIEIMSIMQRLAEYNRYNGKNTLRFDEYLCKNILDFFVKLAGIEVKDRPDLRYVTKDGTIGIEVVNSMPEAYHILWKNVEYQDGQLFVKSSAEKRIEGIINDYFPIVNGQSGVRDVNLNRLDPRLGCLYAIEDIKRAFDKKRKKLAQYEFVDDNWLFIYCQPNIIFSDESIDNLCVYFSRSKTFSTVFVFNEWELYRMTGNMHEMIYCRNDIYYVIEKTLREISNIIQQKGEVNINDSN